MKNLLKLLLVLFAVTSCKTEPIDKKMIAKVMELEQGKHKENIYQFTVKDIEGNDFDFATLRGKKIMIVNTASKCGLTPQYKLLEELYTTYKDSNFVIVGFPANNFLWQEPGTNAQIAEFCKQNYSVTFPMMSKIDVKGKNKHEVYDFLTHKSRNGLQDSKVSWNFQKYLLNEKGELEKIIKPKTLPNDPSVINWIKKTAKTK